MPFMVLMAAPLSREFRLLSHARARTADNLFWRHHVSPTAGVRACGTCQGAWHRSADLDELLADEVIE